MIDGVMKLDGPVIMEISEEVYEKLGDLASDRNTSLDDALTVAVNICYGEYRRYQIRS